MRLIVVIGVVAEAVEVVVTVVVVVVGETVSGVVVEVVAAVGVALVVAVATEKRRELVVEAVDCKGPTSEPVVEAVVSEPSPEAPLVAILGTLSLYLISTLGEDCQHSTR